MLSMLGKHSEDKFKWFSYHFQKIRFDIHAKMPPTAIEDNLHEILDLIVLKQSDKYYLTYRMLSLLRESEWYKC